ncbi:MAG TPA: transcription elongation factor GreA [bacterium]|nr:transcription elongation factor GreA [bacterium]HPN67327.1 transcription elongation factor GreA [bacterium]
MSNDNKYLVTEEGLEEIKVELEKLYEERKQIVEQIKEAKSYGDLSENSEYAEVKDRQLILERRIAELEDYAKKAIIDDKMCQTDKVCVGSKVRVKTGNKKMEYELVGATQANPSSGKISVESPVGRALIGKIEGDEVEVMAPKGKIMLVIESIS